MRIAIIPIIVSVILYLLFNSEKLKNLKFIYKQLIAGIIFGGIAIIGTEFGIDIDGAIINARDAGPLCAGLIFGWPAGIIAGLIGGIERWYAVLWGGGYYTRLACTISTILAGFIAAGLRKIVFDDDIPSFDQALVAGVVVEVIHMLMIFITNVSDVKRAFRFVEACTIPMVSVNALSVGIAVLLIIIVRHYKYSADKKRLPSISSIIQRNLVAVILLGLLFSSLFGYALQDQISKDNTYTMLNQALIDATKDVEDQCDESLLHVNRLVVEALEENPNTDLNELVNRYNIYEIDVIDNRGIIVNSNFYYNVDYDMSWNEQSRIFLDLLKPDGPTEIVQQYMPTGSNPYFNLKYSGVKSGDGFVQVAYNGAQLSKETSSLLANIATNRHIGEQGSLLVLSQDNSIISYTSDSIINPDSADLDIKLDPNGNEEYKVYECSINNEPYYYMFSYTEQHNIVGLLPKSEVNFSKSLSAYLNGLTQTVIFGTLIAGIYFITKLLIVDNIKKVNTSLNSITEGNLDTVVDVKSNREFTLLSDGINTTVDALKRYAEEAKARIETELKYAKEIQSSALPSNFPAFPSRNEFDIYALMNPAKEVGGDFYDFYFVDDDTLVFLVADVSGKGIPASLFMMRSKTILKTYAENGIQVADILTNANYHLCEGNDAGMFVTTWMGFLNLKTGELKYANAGHNAPLLRRKNGEYEYLKGPAGFVLAGMEGILYKEQSITLNPGDEIFLYTDGVPEATNIDNELFGDDRLLNCLNKHLDEDAETLCHSVKKEVDEFFLGAPQFDDITELCVQFKKYSDK